MSERKKITIDRYLKNARNVIKKVTLTSFPMKPKHFAQKRTYFEH
jgi:hypothetical protein